MQAFFAVPEYFRDAHAPRDGCIHIVLVSEL